MSETVLVTGGAGFIGSNFVKHIFNKYPYRIIVLDVLTYAGNVENFSKDIIGSDRFTFWYGNVKNPEIVNTLVLQSDYVVHFAAETHVARSIFDNSVFFETDVLGTQTVANAVLKNQKIKKFIHISTSEVYGTAQINPMNENHPLEPTTPYAGAKAGADRLVSSYYHTYHIPAVIVRPFNNYGPYQHLEKAIPRFITSALEDEEITIHGDGWNSRDWVFVEDTCEAIDLILHADDGKVIGQVFNVCTQVDIAIIDIAKTILKLMGKDDSLITHIVDRPGQVKRHIGSYEKINKVTGWRPNTSFDEGLKRTIEWYKNNKQWWEKLKWMRSVEISAGNGKNYRF